MDQLTIHEDASTADNYDGEYNPGFVQAYDEYESGFTTNETFEPPAEEDTDAATSSLSEDDARQAFLEFAESHCCYISTPAKEITIENIETFSTFRYRLFTFIEERTFKWKSRPYHGEDVDGPDDGPALKKWEVEANCPEWFEEGKDKVIVPYTSSVEVCESCSGRGKIKCMACAGNGKVFCGLCLGTGETFQGTCYTCFGTGEKMCFTCQTTGRITCLNCSGEGQVVVFMQMKVKWKNLDPWSCVREHNSEFPTDRFDKVLGHENLVDEDTTVEPITFSDPFINEASQEAINEHAQIPDDCIIRRQQQTIEWLPLYKVNYSWRGKQGEYFVYGAENKVYCKHYPRKCCCVIM